MQILLMIGTMLLSAVDIGKPVKVDIQPKQQYEAYAEEIAEMYDLDPCLIKAVIQTESSWRAKVESKCGAIGLMQIIPKWHDDRMKRLDVSDLKDPYSNILTGTDYLASLIDRYGNVTEALMVYNMGKKGSRLFKEGKVSKYASKILDLMSEMQEGQ